MNNNQIALSSLAMDLKRVALGYHRGSNTMAERFFKEALKRKNEIDTKSLKPYLKKLIDKLETIKSQENSQKAESALLYSTLLQNAALELN